MYKFLEVITIYKNIYVGIVYKMDIYKDIHNNTFKNNSEFISNKDLIIKLINNVINTCYYDISSNKKCISLELKENIDKTEIYDLIKYYTESFLYKFKYIYNYFENDIYSLDILDSDIYESIDADLDSLYYPISFDTKIVWLFSCRAEDNSSNKDFLDLLRLYSNEFFHTPINSLITFGISD